MLRTPRRGALAGASVALALAWVGAAGADEPLVAYQVKDHAIGTSLTGSPGNAEAGREVFIDRKKGGCLACHKAPIPDELFHGNVGPDLAGVGDRYSEGELRLRVVDAKVINPDTSMPAFYRVDGLHRVRKGFGGKPMLSAQQVEDVVAYLMTLREDGRQAQNR